MPTAVITVQVTGALDQADRRAMLFIVEQENVRRASLNPPLAALSVVDNVAIRTSYAAVQASLLQSSHLSYIEQSNVATLQDIRTLWPNATDQQRAAAKAALQ